MVVDLGAFDLGREDAAGVDQAAVHDHGAGAAVAVVAAFLGAGEADALSQRLEEAVARIGEELLLLAVDRRVDNDAVAQGSLAPSSPLGGLAERALHQHGREVLALLDRAAHVFDGPRGGLRGFAGRLDRLVRQRLADDGAARRRAP